RRRNASTVKKDLLESQRPKETTSETPQVQAAASDGDNRDTHVERINILIPPGRGQDRRYQTIYVCIINWSWFGTTWPECIGLRLKMKGPTRQVCIILSR
ncbi:MAG: hypothetical protein ACKPKO_31935, partial [Candidatus Fonsibacter sp.]